MLDDSLPRRTLSERTRNLVLILLLFIGLQFSLLMGHQSWPPRVGGLIALAAIALASCIPQVARRACALLDRTRTPSARARFCIAIILSIIAAVVLIAEARYQFRTFTPKYQDEFSYIIQTRMIAHGRLWMPEHPLADFFESFQFMAKPIYGSIYFPGAAILFAPGIWLGLPYWVAPLVLSSAVVGLTYRITTELIDGLAGLLSAIMMVSLPMFRMVSLMALAQAPTMFLALAMIAAWLRWRRDRAWRWALIIGIFAGWCAITRPVDALCVAMPVGIAMLVEIRRETARRIAACALALIVGAIPFLSLQLALDYRVTGNLFKTPFDYFAAICYPQTSYGFHGFDSTIRPTSSLPQFQKFYDEHSIPALREHTPEKKLRNWFNRDLSLTILNATPHVLLLMLMPIGLLGLTSGRRWVLFAMLPLFTLLYFPYVFFLTHYTLIAAPAVVLVIALGVHVVENRWPVARAQVSVLVVCAVAALSISEMGPFNRTVWDEFFQAPELQKIDQTLADLEHKPAIVLFRFSDKLSAHIEPVYNTDVIWPDDAPVIRAHDLGEDNFKLFEYYARLQPDRAVYLYDRGDGSIRYLGNVKELASRL